jgi:hypothetical protein
MIETKDDKELDPLDGMNLLKECATIVTSKYYQSFKPGIEDLIRFSKSKSYQTDPQKHLALQWGILNSLEEIEKIISQGRQAARETGDNDYDLQRRRNIYISKAYREVGDGIAWRTLGYSRFKTRILSQGRHAGHTWGKVGRSAELHKAVTATANNNRVLLTDATTCLRVGDLIAVRPDATISIAEIKKKKREPITVYSILEKRKNGQGVTKQEFRLVQAQYAIDTNQFPHEGIQVPLEQISHDTTDFMTEVGNILRQACRLGIYGKLVAPYMHVEAVDINKLMSVDYKKLLKPNRRPDIEPIVQYSNYDKLVIGFHDEAVRSVPPYTVFPFSPKLITKLIIGELFLTVTVYKEPLQAAFRDLGWELVIHKDRLDAHQRVTDEQNVEYFSSVELFPDQINDPNSIMTLRNPNGFSLEVFGHIAAMAQEFISAEYISSFAEAIMGNSTPDISRGTYPDSLTDRSRWV